MVSLQWSSKSDQHNPEGNLLTESIIYPDPGVEGNEDPANRLILGDNLRVMSALLPDYEGKVDLIYVDPPFFTNKGYSARVGRGEDSRKPEQWQLAEGYQDEWDDLNSYLDMLHPRLRLMHRLLSPTGSLFLHLDWHANSYARILLDEIFGYGNFRNEIIWTYHGPSPIKSAFNRKHDMILFYSKTDQYTFNVDEVRVPYASNTIETFKSSKQAGFGKVPDLERGKVPEDWWYFPVVARLHSERTGYPTQKPEALMERIILASTNPGDLVADFFGGAGTTAAVASRLKRQFISSDFQPRALQTTRSRLVLINQQFTDLSPGEKGRPRQIQVQREESQFPLPVIDLSELGLPEPTLKKGVVTLPEELIPQVLYWEIDPEWSGDIYQSKYQAVRPWRKGDISSSILMGEPCEGKVCVRILLVSGDQAQVVL
jgi:DNA modification methylase